MKKKKKLLVLLAILLICPVAMHSQKSVDQIFKEFSKEKGVMRVDIGKFTMTIAGLFTDVMGVNGVEVYTFEECNQSVKERINTAISSMKDAKYETLVSVNEDRERTKILVKTDGETLSELIVLTSGTEPALIRIKGKIKPSDIENVIKQNK